MVDTLEDRIAYWIELETMPYPDLMRIQLDLYEKRRAGEIPDTIITTQHPPSIDFGSRDPDNLLVPEIEAELEARYGPLRTDNGTFRKEAIEALQRDGIRGIPFSKTVRGGGATALAPGILAFYPLVNIAEVTGKAFEEGSTPLSTYKLMIDEIMLHSLEQLGVEGLQIRQNPKYKDMPDRRDIWFESDKQYKIGSKAVYAKIPFALNGFVIHADEAGLEPFRYVHACGYSHEELGVTSIERILGRSVAHADIRESVRNTIKDRFGYTSIEERRLEEL